LRLTKFLIPAQPSDDLALNPPDPQGERDHDQRHPYTAAGGSGRASQALACVNALLERDQRIHDLRVKYLADYSKVLPAGKRRESSTSPVAWVC